MSDLEGKSNLLSFSVEEIDKISLLIVEENSPNRLSIRGALHTLGLRGVSDVATHADAEKRLSERDFTHIIFQAKDTNMPAFDFLRWVLSKDPNTVAIATSNDPQIDNVFRLLQAGARGYLAKPFTAETVENALLQATKGEPLAAAVLEANDRNEAFAYMMTSHLDKTADLIRQSKTHISAKRQVEAALRTLRSSTDLAKTFSEGGTDELLKSLEDLCEKRGDGPASRLGRLRSKLRQQRKFRGK